MTPPFSPFLGGGGANGVILVKLAPLLLHHYGPRPRWPPPLATALNILKENYVIGSLSIHLYKEKNK